MAGSGDKKDSKGGAAIVSGGGMDAVSGGGEKDAKDTASGDATMGRDIDRGAIINICDEIKGEKDKGGATNNIKSVSWGADATGSESTFLGVSVDNGGGANNGGGGGVSVGASMDNGGGVNNRVVVTEHICWSI